MKKTAALGVLLIIIGLLLSNSKQATTPINELLSGEKLTKENSYDRFND